MFAARNGDIEMAKLLIEAGVDVNQTGSDGTHVLPYAIVTGQDTFALQNTGRFPHNLHIEGNGVSVSCHQTAS